jgi:hypothetical protein
MNHQFTSSIQEDKSLNVLQQIKKLFETCNFINQTEGSSDPIEKTAARIASHYGKILVIMGGVAYGVDVSQFDFVDSTTQNVILFFGPKQGSNCIRIIKANIGDYPIAPSRESLSFKGNVLDKLKSLLISQVENFYKDFLDIPMVDKKKICSYINIHNLSPILKQYTNTYNVESTYPQFKEIKFFYPLLHRIEDLDKYFTRPTIQYKKIIRRNSKSFSCRNVFTQPGNFLANLNSLVKSFTFKVDDLTFETLCPEKESWNGALLKHSKVKKNLNYLLETNPDFSKIFYADGCCYVTTEDSYNLIKDYVELPDLFNIMDVVTPKKTYIKSKTTSTVKEKIFFIKDVGYTYDEIIKLKKKGSKILYNVISSSFGVSTSLIIDYNKLKAGDTLKDHIVISDLNDFSLDTQGASYFIENKISKWCDSLELEIPFTDNPLVVNIPFTNFKNLKLKLWEDPLFEDSIVYYGRLISSFIPKWEKEIKKYSHICSWYSYKKTFELSLLKYLEANYIYTKGTSKIWDNLVLLAPILKKGLSANIDLYNNLDNELSRCGFDRAIPEIKFPSLSSITIAENSTEVFKDYPMLKYIDIRDKDAPDKELSKTIAEYIEIIDHLHKK